MIAAVVPAAGRSERMGRPKLLLRLESETVIARVVTALRDGGAERVIVVVPPADSAEGPEIASESMRAGAEVIVPRLRPAAMRDSIELGLAMLARGAPVERVLLSPGDTPGITPVLVARLLECAARWPESIIVPCCEGRRGHPVVLPWDIAALVPTLPAGLGVNALAGRHPDRLVELAVPNPDLAADLDTPDDLRHWNQRRPSENRSAEDSGSPSEAGPPQSPEKLHVQVRLFALAKERAGRSEIDLELAPASRVADLRAALRERLPALAPLLPTVLIAVNEEYAGDDALILPGSRIAVIPPVSGGSGEHGGPPKSRSR
jgi:molybdenum cofactor cytidylyltransferase